MHYTTPFVRQGISLPNVRRKYWYTDKQIPTNTETREAVKGKGKEVKVIWGIETCNEKRPTKKRLKKGAGLKRILHATTISRL